MAMWWLGVLALAQASGTPYAAIHDADAAGYQKWVNGLAAGFRIDQVHVHAARSGPRFGAIAVQDGRRGLARHGLSAADYQKEFDRQSAAGHRPTAVVGYVEGGTLRYAAAWVHEPGGRWSARHGIPDAKFQAEFDAAGRRGERPAFVNGYPTPTGVQFAAVFVPAAGAVASTSHGLTAAQYQAKVTELGRQGFRVAHLSGYAVGPAERYAAVFVKDGKAWGARHGLSAAEYQQEFQRQADNGFRPATITGYLVGNQSRWAAAWTKAGPPPALPISGAAAPGLKALDDAMVKALSDRGWRAGTLAVSRNGRIVFAHGYGFRDAARRQPVQPDTPFRIASIVKPMTAATVRLMDADRTLRLSDRAVAALGAAVGPRGDPRLADVTIEHLLAHRGGWNRDTAPIRDPMFRAVEIAAALRRPAPASARDVVDYMLNQPLEAAPGSTFSYSNFGYCFLGRIVERRSGRGYVEELRRRVGTPLGMSTLALARSLPAARSAAEPNYLDGAGNSVNVFNPAGPRVAAPDGGFHLEAMDAHGGVICSAPDLLRFARAYHVNGRPRTAGDTSTGSHTGSLPGTYGVLAWKGNLEYAALFNQRGGDEAGLLKAIDDAVAAIRTWP